MCLLPPDRSFCDVCCSVLLHNQTYTMVPFAGHNIDTFTLRNGTMATQVLRFACNEEDGSYDFHWPEGAQLRVSSYAVGRSRPLRDMLDSAVASEETTIAFPSDVELSYFHTWASAVQPDSPVFEAGAEELNRCLEVQTGFPMHGMHREVRGGGGTSTVPSRMPHPEVACSGAHSGNISQRCFVGEHRCCRHQGTKPELNMTICLQPDAFEVFLPCRQLTFSLTRT